VLGPEAIAGEWARRLDQMRHPDDPFAFVNGYTHLLVAEAARADGCRILLDGTAGDLLFYWFDQSVSLRGRDLRYLPGILAAYLRHRRLGGIGRALLLRMLVLLAPEALKRVYRGLRTRELPVEAKLLHRALAQDLYARRGGRKPRARDDLVEHAQVFIGGLVPVAYECYNQVAFAHGIEPRSPFADRRMIEFAVTLPRFAKLTSGWYKALARNGMAGILPEEVRWRRDLTMHPGGEFRSRFAAELARRAPDVWNSGYIGARMNRWLDRQSLDRVWRESEAKPDPLMAWLLLSLVSNAQWLASPDRAALNMEA
jgi:asparagine synthetase B (glutamine-hydrolysing)